MAIDAVLQKPGQRPNVPFQPDAPSDLDQMLFPDVPVFRVVRQQVRQCPTLLHEVETKQAGYLLRNQAADR